MNIKEDKIPTSPEEDLDYHLIEWDKQIVHISIFIGEGASEKNKKVHRLG